MVRSRRETEIKLPAPSAEEARRRLRQAGFRLLRRRVFEDNLLFDTPGRRLRRAGAVLRVREMEGRALLTYKGPAEVKRHKSREELEVASAGAATLGLILERLGFRRAFRYQKFRAEYIDDTRAGVATVDETPIGVFVELEGPPRWIDAAARRLGFARRHYITASYARLYRESGRRGDMLFEEADWQPRMNADKRR